MPETTPEAEPLDAEAAYQDSRSVPLSEAWRLLDPAPAPQDRMEAVKSHLLTATLAVVAMLYPPRPDDKPMLLSWELVRLALEHPTVDLSLPADELTTGNTRRGGLQFIMCRAILAVHVASAQPAPGEAKTVTFVEVVEGMAGAMAALETLPERIDAARDRFRGDEFPPVDEKRLIEVLAAMFIDKPEWERAGDERLGYAVASLDSRFRPNRGPRKRGRWNKTTLEQRIKDTRPDAKKLAAYRRQGNS